MVTLLLKCLFFGLSPEFCTKKANLSMDKSRLYSKSKRMTRTHPLLFDRVEKDDRKPTFFNRQPSSFGYK